MREGVRNQQEVRRKDTESMSKATSRSLISTLIVVKRWFPRAECRSVCYEGVEGLQEKTHETMRRRSERRHQEITSQTTQQGELPCQHCGRVCYSRIELHSKVRTHFRTTGERRDVDIGNNELP